MLTIKLNRRLLGKNAGTILRLETDKHGVVIDDFWRARIADARSDNCISIVSETPPEREAFSFKKKSGATAKE